MKKHLVGATVAVASALYKNKKYDIPGAVNQANLGCGMVCVPGWINVDGSLTALLGSRSSTAWNKFLYSLAGSKAYYTFLEFNGTVRKAGFRFADLRRGVPLRDNSADVIFTSHFVEHIKKNDARKFLRDCYRALKPGGLMRIIVPDLDIAFAMFQEGKVEEMQDLFFYNAEHYDFSAHKYNYNFASMKRVLESIGFTNIQKKKFREGECPDIKSLDVYPEHSLYVECRK